MYKNRKNDAQKNNSNKAVRALKRGSRNFQSWGQWEAGLEDRRLLATLTLTAANEVVYSDSSNNNDLETRWSPGDVYDFLDIEPINVVAEPGTTLNALGSGTNHVWITNAWASVQKVFINMTNGGENDIWIRGTTKADVFVETNGGEVKISDDLESPIPPRFNIFGNIDITDGPAQDQTTKLLIVNGGQEQQFDYNSVLGKGLITGFSRDSKVITFDDCAENLTYVSNTGDSRRIVGNLETLNAEFYLGGIHDDEPSGNDYITLSSDSNIQLHTGTGSDRIEVSRAGHVEFWIGNAGDISTDDDFNNDIVIIHSISSDSSSIYAFGEGNLYIDASSVNTTNMIFDLSERDGKCIVYGSQGDDDFTAGKSENFLYGNAGNDYFEIQLGNFSSEFYGGEGDDIFEWEYYEGHLAGYVEYDLYDIFGGSGHDSLLMVSPRYDVRTSLSPILLANRVITSRLDSNDTLKNVIIDSTEVESLAIRYENKYLPLTFTINVDRHTTYEDIAITSDFVFDTPSPVTERASLKINYATDSNDTISIVAASSTDPSEPGTNQQFAQIKGPGPLITFAAFNAGASLIHVNSMLGDDIFKYSGSISGDKMIDLVMEGSSGNDIFYVQNEVSNAVASIIGGDGVDTILVEGTEIADLITVDQTQIDATNSRVVITGPNGNSDNTVEGVELIKILGYGGGDELYVGGTGSLIPYAIYGGFGSDLISGLGYGASVPATATIEAYGEQGRDSLQGGRAIDYLFGGEDADDFVWGDIFNPQGGGNSDVIDGGTGTDRLIVTGTSGTDCFHVAPDDYFSNQVRINVVASGPDNDGSILAADIEQVYLSGGFGDDFFDIKPLKPTTVNLLDIDYGPSGNDVAVLNLPIEGAAISVTPTMSSASAQVNGLPELIRFFNATTADTLKVVGGLGNDVIKIFPQVLATMSVVVDGSDGDDYISGAITAMGGAGDDMIVGTAFADILLGGLGNDSIEGLAGDDLLLGDAEGTGAGTVTITCDGDLSPSMTPFAISAYVTAGGNDTINSGEGNDSLNGGYADDNIYGDAGNDLIGFLAPGSNPALPTAFDEPGADSIWGGTGADSIDGAAGNDEIYGDAGADVIRGGLDNDNIWGGEDADTINGNEGNDSIYGDGGADSIFGDAGNDSIWGGEDADRIEGNQGNDTIHGDAGADTIFGNEDNDAIYGDAGADTIYGNAGNDSIWGGEDADLIEGNTGADTIHGDAGADLIFGNEDNDAIYGDAGNDSIFGNDGDDLIYGGADADQIAGGLGQDTAYGDAGTDLIYGNDGNDELSGGADSDTVYGGLGADVMFGDEGADLLCGGPASTEPADPTLDGNDTMLGGSGNDAVFGDYGNDIVNGGDGNDNLWGNEGNDTLGVIEFRGVLYQDYGADSMVGGVGNDIIAGSLDPQDGNDVMFGQTGNDTLWGGAGGDMLYGGEGEDILLGGTPETANTVHVPRDPNLPQDGNDTMLGGNGFDEVDGGNGNNLMDAGDDGIRETVLGGIGNDMAYNHMKTDPATYDILALDGGFNHKFHDGYLLEPPVPAADCEFVTWVIPTMYYTGYKELHTGDIVEHPPLKYRTTPNNGPNGPVKTPKPIKINTGKAQKPVSKPAINKAVKPFAGKQRTVGALNGTKLTAKK